MVRDHLEKLVKTSIFPRVRELESGYEKIGPDTVRPETVLLDEGDSTFDLDRRNRYDCIGARSTSQIWKLELEMPEWVCFEHFTRALLTEAALRVYPSHGSTKNLTPKILLLNRVSPQHPRRHQSENGSRATFTFTLLDPSDAFSA